MEEFSLFMFLTSGGFLLFIGAWNLVTYVQRRRLEKNSLARRSGTEGAQIRFYKGGEDVE
jgi:hypothetical protein